MIFMALFLKRNEERTMELIKVKNEGYGHYEELLLRRDQLRKEAYHLQKEYVREFGDLITEVFKKKIDCIQKKKTISFCQQAINKGRPVNTEDLRKFLNQEMRSYKESLDKMIEENNMAQDAVRITSSDLLKIKKLYHKLAKQLHPDINPKTESIPELLALWQSTVAAYNANDLKELEETDVLVQAVLKKLKLCNEEIEITDLNVRIAKVQDEILKIKTTDPYCYKFLLDDREAVEKKKQELKKELAEYTKYASELDEIIEQMMSANGVKITWTMS